MIQGTLGLMTNPPSTYKEVQPDDVFQPLEHFQYLPHDIVVSLNESNNPWEDARLTYRVRTLLCDNLRAQAEVIYSSPAAGSARTLRNGGDGTSQGIARRNMNSRRHVAVLRPARAAT